MRRKTVVALGIAAIAAGLLVQATPSAAQMPRGPGLMQGRMMMGPAHRPIGPTGGGLAGRSRNQQFWPTVGFFETRGPAKPPRAGAYDYPGSYAQRFDGVKGQGVGSNKTETIGLNRTHGVGGSSNRPHVSPFDANFQGGVRVGTSGKSSTFIRMAQPHTSASPRHVRHRFFSIVDRTNMQ